MTYNLDSLKAQDESKGVRILPFEWMRKFPVKKADVDVMNDTDAQANADEQGKQSVTST